MTDLTPNHPAVEAAARAMHAAYERRAERWEAFYTRTPWEAIGEDSQAEFIGYVHQPLNAALPHLAADDLRDTDAAEEIRTEGWLQGWAAGRDLDGDEDAIPYLRNTSAGRELMAEGWDALIESMSASGEFHDVDLRTMQRLNPYRKADA